MKSLQQTLRKKYRLTKSGIGRLQAKLQSLHGDRKKLIAHLRNLRTQQSSTRMFAEDSMAIQTLSMLRSTEMAIQQLENTLRNSEIIEEQARLSHDGEVQVGSHVRLRGEGGREITYTIVTSLEADPFQNKISDESPIGRSLLGRKLKDFVLLPSSLRRKLPHQLVGIS
jgi:transcription elongation factor GreA